MSKATFSFFSGALLLLSASATASPTQSPFQWGLNDVSILIPIQDPNVLDALPAANGAGAFGALLPESVRKKIGKLQSFEEEDVSFSTLRVVAVRIDPCFPAPENANVCRPQVRLVWQPIQVIRGISTGADAAVHTFYKLPPSDFDAMTAELRDLRTSNEGPNPQRGAPLSIHPIISAQGLNGSYFQGLKAILLKHIGASRLTRATFLKLSSGFFLWDFGGFDIAKGQISMMQIPRIGKPRQMFTNDVMPGETDFASSGIAPAPLPNIANVNFISSDSARVRGKNEAPLILSNLMDAVRFENPRNFKTAELDCVSCHIAQSAKLWTLREFPELGVEAAKAAYTSNTQSLTNTSVAGPMTANTRSFGYFYRDAAISDRVIHESAEVADALNAQNISRGK